MGPRAAAAEAGAVEFCVGAGFCGGAKVSGTLAEFTRAGLIGAGGAVKGEKDDIRIDTL